MHAKLLRYGVAPEVLPDPPDCPGEHPAWKDPPVSVADPLWAEVEAAVRRLDARRYRWLHLWPTADERVIDVNPGTSEFVGVYGGAGAYVTHISFADGRDASLHFPGRSRKEVVVVLPDPWGFANGAFSEAASCVYRDVEVVVRAVRHYCETGGLEPSLAWEVHRDNTIYINLQPKDVESGERNASLLELEAIGRRMSADTVSRLVAPPPDLAGFPMAGPGSTYDPGEALGWYLPNGLVLFLWATLPYPPLTGAADMRNPLSGFIGVPGGYHEDVGRAVAAPPGKGPLGGLPLLWGSAWGSPLPFRWAGPKPGGQSWFMFSGAQSDLDEPFRRARAFASGYDSTRHAEPGVAPDGRGV